MRIRSHGLTRNLNSEVARANTVCKAKDVDADQVRFYLTNHWRAQLPEGLDPCLPEDVLKDFKAFQRAMLNWGAPTENQVYADVKGNIGWVPGGLAPKRPNWDGLLPVPGDGRYEWAGFWRGDQLPWSYNPPEGWVATANAYNIPAGYPATLRKLGFEWTNPFPRPGNGANSITISASILLPPWWTTVRVRKSIERCEGKLLTSD